MQFAHVCPLLVQSTMVIDEKGSAGGQTCGQTALHLANLWANCTLFGHVLRKYLFHIGNFFFVIHTCKLYIILILILFFFTP